MGSKVKISKIAILGAFLVFSFVAISRFSATRQFLSQNSGVLDMQKAVQNSAMEVQRRMLSIDDVGLESRVISPIHRGLNQG